MNEKKEVYQWPEVDQSHAMEWLNNMWAKTRDSRLFCASSEDTAWTMAQYHAHMEQKSKQ